MTAHGPGHLDPHERRQFNAPGVSLGLLVVGLVVLIAAFLLSLLSPDGTRRFWLAYVHNFAFFLSLSLGGLFFVLLQHLTRAGWSVVVRRPAEAVAMNLIPLTALFLPIAVVVLSGTGIPYPWAQPVSAFQHDGHAAHAEATASAGPTIRPAVAGASDPVEFRLAADTGAGNSQETTHSDVGTPGSQSPALKGDYGSQESRADSTGNKDHAGGHEDHAAGHLEGHAAQLILEKRAYLNPSFFLIRWGVYFAIWAVLAWWFWSRSVRQDASGDVGLTLSMQTVSAPAVLAFGLTATLASFDLLMSLDPVWFSTIFGVYYFAGGAIGFFALLIILIAGLQKQGLLTSSVNAEHYHDLGKFLFGFVFFWGYIAFSQYMLIWYGNIPEETGWFFRRGCATHAPNIWSYVIVLLLVAHFIVPFVVLLSRDVKRRLRLLTFWAVWMLILHWIDLYWLVMPELTVSYLPLGVAEIGCLIGMGAVFAAGLNWWAGGRSLVPVRDPRLGESLSFVNL